MSRRTLDYGSYKIRWRDKDTGRCHNCRVDHYPHAVFFEQLLQSIANSTETESQHRKHLPNHQSVQNWAQPIIDPIHTPHNTLPPFFVSSSPKQPNRHHVNIDSGTSPPSILLSSFCKTDCEILLLMAANTSLNTMLHGLGLVNVKHWSVCKCSSSLT